MENRLPQAITKVILFFLMITAFFYLILVGNMPTYKAPSTQEELRCTDLSREYISLAKQNTETYPGRLYTPEDFAAGKRDPGDSSAKYATHRVVLDLEPGITYGLTGMTATYAQRVYINGELLSQVGTVSSDPAAFVPRTDSFTVYFTPQTSQTEIVIQNAWFNHQSGAMHKLYLAQQQVIVRCNRAQALGDGLIVGSLFAMGLFFAGMFLFRTGSPSMLWFALSCLAAAIHYLIYESKQIMVFFPGLNWYVGHKIEYICNILQFLFIILYACTLLKLHPGKRITRLFCCAIGILILYYILAPSTFYTRYIVPVSALYILLQLAVTGYLLWKSGKSGMLRQLDRLIVCMTVVMAALVYLVEGLTYFVHVFYLRSYATILFSFVNAIVLTINFARTKRDLNEAIRREQQITESNNTLERMNRLKTEVMHNIAHEMKTPLTVMSGYAQLTELEIRQHAVNEETLLNLSVIADEAQRLASMVTELLNVTYGRQDAATLHRLEPGALLRDAAAVCRPILNKRDNRLILRCDSCPDIRANHEMLLQVLINLAVNAGKHTEKGTVTFSAQPDPEQPGLTVFRVTDSGSGIAPAMQGHEFEKGQSGDGGNGLGLSICREIIESLGGTIRIEKTGSSGTTVCFTVPVWEEAYEDHSAG